MLYVCIHITIFCEYPWVIVEILCGVNKFDLFYMFQTVLIMGVGHILSLTSDYDTHGSKHALLWTSWFYAYIYIIDKDGCLCLIYIEKKVLKYKKGEGIPW